jgi:hypothetical protein
MIAFPSKGMTVAELVEFGFLSGPACELARPELALRRFFDALMQRELHADAIQVLPHLLTKRAAVWWGALYAWQANRPEPPAAFAAALEAALNWVYDPSEEHRRAAEAPAEAVNMRSSAGCLASAAFWSDGSMARPDLPIVAPPPHLTAVCVGGAVLLACVEREPMHYLDHYRQALELGIEIARGRLLWTPSGTLEAVADPRGELLLRRGGVAEPDRVGASEGQS